MAIIMIVEDEDQVRVLAEAILEEAGHTTLSAGDLAEGQALLESGEKFDVLFTDINLKSQEHGGLELASAARERRPDVAVLYTSGAAMTDGMKAMMVEGARFLHKPYQPADLLSNLQELLGR